MALRLPDLIKPGEAIKAEHFNALLQTVRALANIRGGHGISAFGTLDGIVVSFLGAMKERVVWCKVVKVHKPGSTAAPASPDLPSNVLYDVKSLDKQWTWRNLTPTYGRPVHLDEAGIYACPVGRYCAVLANKYGIVPTPELWIFGELPALGPCGAGT